MNNLLITIHNALTNYKFTIIAASVASLFNLGLLYGLFHIRPSNKYLRRSFVFAGIFFASAIIVDSSWIPFLMRNEDGGPPALSQFAALHARIAWLGILAFFQSLVLFVESLLGRHFKIELRHKIFLTLTVIIGLPILYETVAYFSVFNFSDAAKLQWFNKWQTGIKVYGLLLVIVAMIIFVKKLHNLTIPKLLKKQLLTLIYFVILPSTILISLPSIITSPNAFFSENWMRLQIERFPILDNFLSIVTSLAIYFVVRSMGKFRFLNMRKHVEAPVQFSFIDKFKILLRELSQISTVQELTAIVQSFFDEAFDVNRRSIHFVVKPYGITSAQETNPSSSNVEIIVKNFLHMGPISQQVNEYLKKTKILITDEIAFDQFYSDNEIYEPILEFLNVLNAAVFLPIYYNENIVAYLIIDREARNTKKFYDNVERDEMIVFAEHMGNILHLLQTRDVDLVHAHEKKLKEQLQSKEQEIALYHETILTSIQETRSKKIGIIFYKNRNFLVGNVDAQSMIPVNLNIQEGHPLTKACKKVVGYVEKYKMLYKTVVDDGMGRNIVITGLPHSERNEVIMTVAYQESISKITQMIDNFPDQNDWNYVAYLQSTQAGNLIEEFIPGTTPSIMNFKVALLRHILNKRFMLITGPQDDCTHIATIAHRISNRPQFHHLTTQNKQGSYDNKSISTELFGMNSVFSVQHTTPLLERADKNGIIFIDGIHALDLATQELLAEFLHYGLYRVHQDDQKRASSAHIICSTNVDLEKHLYEGKFSRKLYKELKENRLLVPTISSVPDDELEHLVDQFTRKSLSDHTYKNILSFSAHDKEKFVSHPPASFVKFRHDIVLYLKEKAKKTSISPAISIKNPILSEQQELQEAVRLGRQALKNKRIMAVLWEKFKNQNKIAEFLGVNRSSVSRRFKEYNLGDSQKN